MAEINRVIKLLAFIFVFVTHIIKINTFFTIEPKTGVNSF